MKNALRFLLVTGGLLLCTQFTFAQFTAQGSVKDESGEPLIGATVQVKGTTTGTVTDFEGNFSIVVPGSQGTLVISYTGYQTQEFSVSSALPTLNAVLKVSAEVLEEVIVTGYGTTRKEALTGSVQSLRNDKLEQVPLSSIEQTLQGNVAGVQVNMGNGQPGANVQVRVRGQGSISASSDPLYVIDGLPVISGDLSNNSETSNPLATINPNDIESVSILKDASATAIYGARGANGVILITTKSGKAGKAKIDLRTQIGFNDWSISEDKRLRGLSAREYTELYIDGWLARGETADKAISRFNSFYKDPQTNLPAVDITATGPDTYEIGTIRVDTRWIDELTRTGLNQSYDLSISGGNDVVTYFASAGYFKQESPIIYSQMDRYSSRLNLVVKATEWLSFTNNLNISQTGMQGMNDETRWANPMYNGYLLPPVLPIFDAQGRYFGDHADLSGLIGGNNPIGSLSGDDTQEWTMTRVLDNLTGTVKLAQGLTFKSSWAFDLLNFQEFYFRNGRYGDGRTDGGIGSETNRNQLNWIGTQTLNYERSFGESHNFDFVAGYEANKYDQRSVFTTAIGYPHPDLRTLASAANPDGASSTLSEYSFNSIFGRMNYNFRYKYYLSGSIRRDGSSRFGQNNRWGTFWSVGASWRIDQERFMESAGFVNDLKLRASYGITGNAGIGNYESIPTFTFSGIDYDGTPGGAPGSIGNVDLTWEEAANLNIGLDFGFFDRISGTVEYFRRENTNLLLDLPVSRTTGFRTVTRNFGAMENKGVELTMNVDILRGDFNWSVGGNVTFLKNRITKLDEPFVDGTGDRFRREEGRDYNEYHLQEWAGVDPQTGRPLWYTDASREATTETINNAERFYIGKSPTPKAFGGFNTNLSFKGFSIDAQFFYSWDAWIYDGTAWVIQGDGRFTPRSQTQLGNARWKQPGDITNVPQFKWGGNQGSNSHSTRYLLDGTYIRLRNLTVGYNLPTPFVSKINLRSVRVYLRGVNLWTWTRDEDLYTDPEVDFNGYIGSFVPQLKTISFGLDIGL